MFFFFLSNCDEHVDIPVFAKFQTFDKEWGFGSISNFRKFKVALDLTHVFFCSTLQNFVCKNCCHNSIVKLVVCRSRLHGTKELL